LQSNQKFAEDLDMLEVGNPGLTVDEQQTHFAFWAAVK
jgi:alpha-galactosidase